MKKQFLYGRKKAGYSQVNTDFPVTDKQLLLQLTSMQNYIMTPGLDINDLPEEYYAYAECIDGDFVWIEGKTSFVPAGTCEESGTRDTSMLHKVIYSGEDYDEKMKNPVGSASQAFCANVEDYFENRTTVLDDGAGCDYQQIYEYYGLDDEKMKDFIYCCLEAFPNSEKRVYCYLPSANREGSIWAKRLMEMILSNVPSCIVSGAGFTTYSPGFHNMMTNPIPGNLSVIFIPDTMDNRMQEMRERKDHYVFDFKKYQIQSNNTSGYVGVLIDFVLKKIKNEECNPVIDQAIQKMNHFVKRGYGVDTKFLGAYMIHSLRDKIMAGDRSKAQRSVAFAIRDLLQYEEALTDVAKREIQELTQNLLYGSECKEDDFEWYDEIYMGGELCKDVVIQYLCVKCLNEVTMHSETADEKIQFIVNYEYRDEALNDYLVEELYSHEKYFQVGKCLVRETLRPLEKDGKRTVQKKLNMICSYVKSFYQEYHEFAISKEFREEIETALFKCMEQSTEKRQDFTELVEKMNNISDQIYELFCPLFQKMAYYLLNSFLQNPTFKDKSEETFTFYTDLIEVWELRAYEKTCEEKGANSIIEIIENESSRRTLNSAFSGMNEVKLYRTLREYSFSEAVNICKRYETYMKYYLDMYATNQNEDSMYRSELFLYFYATGNESIMEAILKQVCERNELDGLREFYLEADHMLHGADVDKSFDMVTKVLKENPKFWESKKKLSWELQDFLFKHGIDVISIQEEKKKNPFGWMEDRKKEDPDAPGEKEDIEEIQISASKVAEEDADNADAGSKKRNPFSFFGGSKKKQ